VKAYATILSVTGGIGLLASATLSDAWAAEGASSHYLPGTAGDLGLAIPPEPGLQLSNVLYIQAGQTSVAVLQGQVDLSPKLTMVLDIASAFYTIDAPFLGGTFTFGASIPFGGANLNTTLTGPKGGSISASENSFNLSDISVVPVQLNWTLGDFHLNLAQTVIAPTGGYDLNSAINLGRNYWSFDTVGAMTYLNTETGTEASIKPGFMVNTSNNATDYKTGNEFHLDFTANQFVLPSVALGLRGYYYQQVTGDSGSGASLGDFKSSSVGLGAGITWVPEIAKGDLYLAGKWMTDVYAKNRFDSNYGMITIGLQF